MNNTLEQLPTLLPVTILITSFNRLSLLEKTINLINERTFHPFRIIVIDNNSTDGSVGYLKTAKVHGKIFDHLFLEENIGQSKALNEGFKVMEKWENEKRRPSNDFFISTNEDIFPPMLGQSNCWLTQMIDILERHEPEYGGICMRIQRTARTEIDESTEIIPCYKGFPSVFRLMRRSDMRRLGDRPFGRLQKWDSNSTADKFKLQIKKKFGFTTHIYADHAGFMKENRGYGKGFIDYFTFAANKTNIQNEKPYPEIDPLTNVPIKINHPCDSAEQEKRDSKIEKPEVTVIVLTCHRYEGLVRIIDSIRNKTNDIKYELLVMIDNDDTESYNYCIQNNIKCLLSGFHRDFVAQANLGIYACETPYFVKFDDDMDVVDNDWLSKGLKIFKEKFPTDIGLMLFNDGIQGGKVFTTGISSKKFVFAAGGNMYFPGYKHFGGDRELVKLSKEMGYYHYEDSIHIKHHHWQSDNNVEEDETYKLSKNKFWQQDQDLKRHRQKNVNLIAEGNYYNYKNL